MEKAGPQIQEEVEVCPCQGAEGEEEQEEGTDWDEQREERSWGERAVGDLDSAHLHASEMELQIARHI